MKKIGLLVKENRSLFAFLGWAFLLLILWVVMDAFFHDQLMQAHYLLIEGQTKISVWLLDLAGFVAEAEYGIPGYMSMITVENSASIYVGSGCSGLELFLIFAGFILIFRGRIRNKIWFLPMGLLIILSLNIVRICALVLLFYYAPGYMEFNHKYTFVFIVYGTIFLLWFWWVNRYAKMKLKERS